MNHRIAIVAPLALFLFATTSNAQIPFGPPAGTTLKTNVDEVVLDIVVRDKKGKPVSDLQPGDLVVNDNGVKQTIKTFRLVHGAEAVSSTGATNTLDPLRQLRLVTLAFDVLGAADQRKTARTAALDLVQSDQGANVFYAVVVINTRLLVLQQFTKDKDALAKAIDRATSGLGANTLTSESESIKDALKRNLPGPAQDADLTAAAGAQAANAQTGNGPPAGGGAQFVDAKLASVLLDMLRMDAAVASQGTRLSLSALESLVHGLQTMPGRKSILYFTAGMYLTPELDVPFRTIISNANRSNVTFYSVDTRGVMVAAQNAGAAQQLRGATNASSTTVNRLGGAVTKEEVMSGDNAEVSARANVQMAVRDLAESTGGFLIGDSNDLRGPVHRVSEEIASYYELTFNPGIQNYDGSFRKLAVTSPRKDLVIHARNGYFALPPETIGTGVQPFELPLLKALSTSETQTDVEFRSGVVQLKSAADGTGVYLMVEVPLRTLQAQADAEKKTSSVHFSLGALVKDDKGEVVQKLTRDRYLQVTAEQMKAGNFIDKMTATLPSGHYKLESAVIDRVSGKIGTLRSEFNINSKAAGVGISSLTTVRAYTPDVKGLDPAEPFQYQGGSITPTLNTNVSRAPGSALRLFFTVYQDAAITEKPAVDIEFLQNGKALQKAPMPLPPADAQGRIPYVMTIPASAIPPGLYEIRATARQGATSSQTNTFVRIEAM